MSATIHEHEANAILRELDTERRENAALRNALVALADRVYWWSLDIMQERDITVLAVARSLGWVPWHERDPEARAYLTSLGHQSEPHTTQPAARPAPGAGEVAE